MELTYIAHEFPSVSQTFVWNEFVQVRRYFPTARLYALHESNHFEKSVISLPRLFRSPKYWSRIGPCLVRLLKSADWWYYVLARDWQTFIRKIFATANGLALAAQCKSGGQHFHAHFLGRTLEVAYIAKLALPRDTASISATGHAADVIGRDFDNLYCRIVSATAFIVAASNPVRESLSAAFPRIPSVVIHCGVEPASDGVGVTDRRKTLTLVTVARVVEKKGYEIAIDIAFEMLRRGYLFKWIAIGTGPLLPHLEKKSRPLEARGFWCWRRAQSHNEVLRCLDEEATIFVLPCVASKDGDVDGIPVALMEAMARAIPVVTSDTGRLLPPGDRDGFVKSIEELSDDVEIRRKLGHAGQRHVRRHFSQEVEARKLGQLFQTGLLTSASSISHISAQGH
jgi:colanic acid/amylovoran biosynthesis glycosyltransferase